MKKVITIMMLAVAIIIGGATMDAKSSSKKKSSKSSSSSSWNGDIPSASVIINVYKKGNGSELKKHGYKEVDNSRNSGDIIDISWIKSGVCKITYTHGLEAGDDNLIIDVYDSSKRTKLYNSLKSYVSKKSGYSVYYSDSQIIINYDSDF